MKTIKKIILMLIFLFIGITLNAQNKDYYISINGKGRTASKEQPAKDLAAVIMKLKAGDKVHIAGGTYKSKSGRGSDVIPVSVSIIGGYSGKTQNDINRNK